MLLDEIIHRLSKFLLLTIACWGIDLACCIGQDQASTAEVVGARKGTRWVVPVAASGKTLIPRVCASLRAAYFEGFPENPVIVHPEIEYWEIRFKGEPISSNVILEFDSYPATLDEMMPQKQASDGTLTLSCSHGITAGEKLRFEPQPHKNTIGYWAVASDSVSWPVKITKPGAFNLGLLQGASEKGGGVARISILSDGKVVDSVDYQVAVTGHFQNFVWKHAGTLNIAKAGDYSVRIEAVKIDTVALMDVRQVHLSPNPLGSKN